MEVCKSKKLIERLHCVVTIREPQAKPVSIRSYQLDHLGPPLRYVELSRCARRLRFPLRCAKAGDERRSFFENIAQGFSTRALLICLESQGQALALCLELLVQALGFRVKGVPLTRLACVQLTRKAAPSSR